MCLGIPGKVVEPPAEVDGLAYAVVEFGGLRRSVCVACVPEAGPGDFVVVHAGIAIGTLDADGAERLLQDLRAIGAGEDGDAIPG